MTSSQWTIALRPTRLQDCYGLDKIKNYFYSASKDHSFPTATLLQGRFGQGKTTVAKIIASMIVSPTGIPYNDKNGKLIGYDADPTSPAVESIIDEKFNRDVIQIDGGQAGKDDLIDRLTSFVATPPFKDRAKVVMIEEVQELSDKAKNSLLKMIETRKPNIYYIFTAMEDLKASGLTSRCVTFKFPYESVDHIVSFLVSVLKKIDMSDEVGKKIVEAKFATDGIHLIAENASGSFRNALQKTQQCILMEAFTRDDIIKNCDVDNYADFYKTMQLILDGDKSELLFNTLLNSEDYLKSFNLSIKVIADAECYRLFKKVPGENIYFEKQAAALAANENFALLRDGFVKIQQENGAYMKQSAYVLGVCKIIDDCCKNKSTQVLNEAAVPTRKIVTRGQTK